LNIYAQAIPGLQVRAAMIMEEIITHIALPERLIAHEKKDMKSGC